MKSLTWEQIISGEFDEGDNLSWTPGTRVVIEEQIVNKLIEENYTWPNGSPIHHDHRDIRYGGEYGLTIKSDSKICRWFPVSDLQRAGLQIYTYSPQSQNQQPSGPSQSCPLCHSDGDDLVFGFYCSNTKCPNFRD